MQSPYSDSTIDRILLTLESIEETIINLIEWNRNVKSAEDYYTTQSGMQLLAANCTLITAIGEGINRINKFSPDFLQTNFPNIPWRAIIDMRNHIAHGYFELDAEMVFDAIAYDIPPLYTTIKSSIRLCRQ